MNRALSILAFIFSLIEASAVIGEPVRLEWTADVDPTGASTFNLPIELPQVASGFVPSLEIEYNSRKTDGYMGWGFSIKGISQISRGGKIRGRDGICDDVNVDSKDNIMLDGILLKGKGLMRYYPDRDESFEAHADSDTNPMTFTVQRPDGTKAVYGSGNNSRTYTTVDNEQRVLFWNISTLSDRNGNYISFSYKKDNTSKKPLISYIRYGSNDKIPTTFPYEIRFSYISRNKHNVAYVGNTTLFDSNLLDCISIVKNGNLIRKYKFSYDNSHIVPLLQSITLYGDDGSMHGAPTTFKWKVPQLNDIRLRSWQTADFTNATPYVGDYNGDGISDVLLVANSNASWKGWKLYTCNSTGVLSHVSSGEVLEGYRKMHIGDFNGDGLCDFIQERQVNRPYVNYFVYYSDGKNFTYGGPAKATVQKNMEAAVGDLDGDGLADLLLYMPNSPEAYAYVALNTDQPLDREITITPRNKWGNVVLADFNGDSKCEILNCYESGADLHSPYNNSIPVYFIGSINIQSNIRVGDFNGDGRCDILKLPKTNETQWSGLPIYFGAGNRFVSSSFPRPFSTVEYNPIVLDANGDGRDDIYCITKENTAQALKIFVNQGDGSDFTPYSGPAVENDGQYTYLVGDYYGTNCNDLLMVPTSKNSAQKGYKILGQITGNECSISEIHDGLGNATHFGYSFTTKGESIYSSKETVELPVRRLNTALQVVSAMSSSDNSGNMTTTAYSYKNGRVHTLGYGFLGFGSVIKTVQGKGIITEDEYTYDKRWFHCGKSGQTTTVNGFKQSRQTIENKIFTSRDNVKSFRPTTISTISYAPGIGTQIITKRDSYDYDDMGSITRFCSVTNGDSTIVQRTYPLNDSYNPIVFPAEEHQRIIRKNGYTADIKNEYTYDDNFNVLTQTTTQGSATFTKKSSYDLTGKLIGVEFIGNDGAKRQESFKYNNVGDALTEHSWGLGQVKETYKYDAKGRISAYTDKNNIKTTYEYDALGRCVKTTKAGISETNKIAWSYGISHAPRGAAYYVRTSSAGNSDVDVFYDSNGRKLRQAYHVMPSDLVYTDWAYDKWGILKSETTPYFAGTVPGFTLYSHDHYDRVTSIQYPDGTSDDYSYGIDEDGNPTISVTDRNGQTKTVSQNYRQETTKVVTPVSTISMTYNALGKCTLVSGEKVSSSMQYDDSGNRTSIDEGGETTTFSYDAFGQMTQTAYPNGDKITFEYDELGRLTSRTADGLTTSYSYNKTMPGLVERIYNPTDSIDISYKYDQGGRVIKETTTHSPGNVFNIDIRYDSFGRKSSIVYPDGYQVMYTYTKYGDISSVRDIVGGGLLWTATAWDARRRVTDYTLGTTDVSYKYDPITSLLTQIDNGTHQTIKYEYDAIGNTTRREYNGNYEDFSYTDGMLSEISVNGAVETSLFYDKAGNITERLGSSDYEADYAPYSNKQTEIRAMARLGRPTELYMTVSDFSTAEYYADQRVATLGIGLYTHNFKYRPDGSVHKYEHTRRRHPTLTELNANRYFTRRIHGDTIWNICHIYVGDECIGMTVNKTDVRLYLKDAQKSVLCVVDRNDKLLDRFSYTAWGLTRDPDTWQESYPTQNFYPAFAGHKQIGGELYLMKNRLYDAALCRFLSLDSYVQAPQDPLSYNRYIYCLNNPLKYHDPDGEFFLVDDFLVGFFKGLFKKKNPFKTGWKHMHNSLRIMGGLFRTDSNKNFWGRTWEFISRFTWQLPQTFLGYEVAHGYNMFGNVTNVSGAFGATTITTTNMKKGQAVTLGNYIMGHSGLTASPGNSTFQHEYGHYLQSQSMGWGYLFAVGIPSLKSAAQRDNHKYQPYEVDANQRAFIYFNKNVDGFYKTYGEYYGRDKNDYFGWHFDDHPLTTNKQMEYFDYMNPSSMSAMHSSLSFGARWYHYLFPLISPLF